MVSDSLFLVQTAVPSTRASSPSVTTATGHALGFDSPIELYVPIPELGNDLERGCRKINNSWQASNAAPFSDPCPENSTFVLVLLRSDESDEWKFSYFSQASDIRSYYKNRRQTINSSNFIF